MVPCIYSYTLHICRWESCHYISGCAGVCRVSESLICCLHSFVWVFSHPTVCMCRGCRSCRLFLRPHLQENFEYYPCKLSSYAKKDSAWHTECERARVARAYTHIEEERERDILKERERQRPRVRERERDYRMYKWRRSGRERERERGKERERARERERVREI